MQISQSSRDDAVVARAGDLVVVRRARWRIVRIRSYDECQMLTLRGVAPPQLDRERQILVPFDRIEPIVHASRPRIVRSVTWRRACRALIALDGPPGSLRAARNARVDLLPHQLEPAMAVLRGLATRLLLADEVGLGKTIQAGLIAGELLARGAIDRVLVLTPPGLRDQWLQELIRRFAIDAAGIDGRALRQRGATLPIGVNPWQTIPVAVVSIDYVKRPEVFPAVAACRWDLVIIDEAHACAGESDRRGAVHALAAAAPYVLLLSATPHNGDRESFAALCDLGRSRSPTEADDPPLLVFRRTRAEAGIGTARRIHVLRVRPNTAERRMHALLSGYSDAIRGERGSRESDAWIRLSVLHKRALSSAWSLRRSVERRLATLTIDATVTAQLTLPLGDPQGELIADDEAPTWPAGLGLADPERDRRLLARLERCARAASARESKIEALARLLSRVGEPAIVFTEFRDTLLHLQHSLARPAMVLHGGLTRDQRSSVIAAFSRARCGLLLATDAAAEGLNLHHHCRLVINLELPWNPMRLEQRIGRVDRIGQRRPVHAFHLVARDTGETRLLARLRRKVSAAQSDIGAPDPLQDERHIARAVIEGDESE